MVMVQSFFWRLAARFSDVISFIMAQNIYRFWLLTNGFNTC